MDVKKNRYTKRSRLERLVFSIRKLVCRDNNENEEEKKLNETNIEEEIEEIRETLARRCISQDFISEMREAFHLFDKVSYMIINR